MVIHRDTFDIYKTHDVNYSLVGGSEEGISWRNVFGQLVTAVVVGPDNIPAAGIYEVTIDEDSWDLFVAYGEANNYTGANYYYPLKLNITSYDPRNKLSFEANTSVTISVFSSTGQTGIIPGFTLTLSMWPNIHLYDKFHLIVGGRWLADEDRYLKDTMFNELSSSGPATSEVTFTVKNVSETTLANVEAKVVNKISVLQDSNMLKSDVLNQIWAQVSTYYGDHNAGYIAHPYDITVTMTAIDTPFPIKTFQTGQGNGIWRLFERTTNLPNPGYPENIYSQTPIWVGEYSATSPNFADGSVTAYKRCLNEINAIRYDFGKGNFKLINGLAFWDRYHIISFAIYGSKDDVDIPRNWDMLLGETESKLGGTHTAQLFYTNHYVRYWYCNTINEYRHFKIVPLEIEFTANTLPPNTSMAPSINRIEFLTVPIPASYKPYTYKPFTFVARNNGGNPIVANYNEQPVEITFANVATSKADILINHKSYDVYEVVSGIRIAEGKGLSCDGTTEYVFADSSLYAGLAFILSATLEAESIAHIYTTHGSDVFEIYSDDDIWKDKGEKISVADTLAPDDTFELSVRANPTPGITNPTTYPVEGLIEVAGYSEATETLFTGSMVYDSSPAAGYSSVRNVIGPFNFTGTQVRFRFKDTNTPIYSVYFGTQLVSCKFGVGKINLTFDEGAWTSSEITNIWTDWMPFDFKPEVTYLLSYEGGDGTYKNNTYTCVSYRCKDNTSQIDDVEYSTIQAASCLGIVEMQIVILEPHIAIVPLAAVVRDGIPSFTIDVNIVDEATAAALAEYGIVGMEIS